MSIDVAVDVVTVYKRLGPDGSQNLPPRSDLTNKKKVIITNEDSTSQTQTKGTINRFC